MSRRPKILVVDSDLHALSKLYLGLIHKSYKVEATDDGGEILQRTERFKPRLLIINMAARNMTTEVFDTLRKKRISIMLINPNGDPVPLDERKAEVLEYPVDGVVLDVKIRELFGIVD
jgi:CheY-like chemotaxis protein